MRSHRAERDKSMGSHHLIMGDHQPSQLSRGVIQALYRYHKETNGDYKNGKVLHHTKFTVTTTFDLTKLGYQDNGILASWTLKGRI